MVYCTNLGRYIDKSVPTYLEPTSMYIGPLELKDLGPLQFTHQCTNIEATCFVGYIPFFSVYIELLILVQNEK